MSYLGCRGGLCQPIQLLLAVPDDASVLPSRQGRRYGLVLVVTVKYSVLVPKVADPHLFHPDPDPSFWDERQSGSGL
jgi:hypothetical protein